jgi:hypothetical protein
VRASGALWIDEERQTSNSAEGQNHSVESKEMRQEY